MRNYKRIMCFGGHSFDAEVMGGPMMIKHALLGAHCTFVHVTTGRLEDPNATEEAKKIYLEKIKKETNSAAKIMNCDCISLGYTSSTLPSVTTFVSNMVELIKRENVDCVITHSRGTLHPRHYFTYETITEAIRILRNEGYQIQLYYGENCEDLIGFSPTNYVSMSKENMETWFAGLSEYSLFHGGINNMPYRDYYSSMSLVRACEAGFNGYCKAYMHGALIDNE